jgi:hypothetical protein
MAGQAVSLGHTIVTDNEVEFARTDGLRQENWLRDTCFLLRAGACRPQFGGSSSTFASVRSGVSKPSVDQS